MKFSYAISKRAVKDLEEIWAYTVESWSIKQATFYYELLISEIEELCKNPLASKSQRSILNSQWKETLLFNK